MGSPITCHVLDASLGRPARGVKATLFRLSSDFLTSSVISTGETNQDGRIPTLVPDEFKDKLNWKDGGLFRLRFETKEYFERNGRATFYPFVDVAFSIPSYPEGHYHVPLLLSPFSYTTYRGS